MDFYPTMIESNETRWRDALAVLLLILSIILLPVLWPLYLVRRYYGLQFRGFWVTRQGRDLIEYQEVRKGKVVRLTIYCERMASAPHVVNIPAPEEWKQTMPDWAQGRREEIVENVKNQLGTKNYEYDYA